MRLQGALNALFDASYKTRVKGARIKKLAFNALLAAYLPRARTALQTRVLRGCVLRGLTDSLYFISLIPKVGTVMFFIKQ